MDARSVAEAAGIEVGTLNVWVQRGLIAGMTIGARGRQREFDLDTATHIVMMAELVRLGFGAPFASWIVPQGRHHKRLLIAKNQSKADASYPPEAIGTQTVRHTALFPCVGFDSEAELPDKLAEFPGGRPNVYVVVDAERLVARTRQIYEQWEQRKQAER